MRARGLKLRSLRPEYASCIVAPHAGAWVETLYDHNYKGDYLVAPHAGAWVETNAYLDINGFYKSRPMRARGLKLIISFSKKLISRRAPCGRVG